MTSPTERTADAAPPVDRDLLDFAVDLVREAGDFTLGYFKSIGLDVEHKDDGSPVTEADTGAERLLRERIAARFPDDAVLGEEEGDTAGSSGRQWVIDPIDGTMAFTHGVGLYSNLLYLEDEHGPAIGVIGLPALDEIVFAGRGLGCFFNGEPCHVSSRTTLADSYLTTCGFDYWSKDLLARAHAAPIHLRTWGDGYGYALVATGRVDAMVDPVIKYWDIAPCQVINPEAGGRFTALSGADDAHAGDAIATNGLLHEQFLDLLAGR
jgi:histidinol phosphatase-like enzyme (inositol monophosphatase family)